MVRAEAIAAFSTTRRNSSARSLSMFSPKLFTFASARVSVAMRAYQKYETGLRIYRYWAEEGKDGDHLWRCQHFLCVNKIDSLKTVCFYFVLSLPIMVAWLRLVIFFSDLSARPS